MVQNKTFWLLSAKKQKAKKQSGAAADAFFASFLGTKKEVGNGGKAPDTPR